MRPAYLALLGLVLLLGCTGHQTSDRPPIHLVQNMDEQPKVKQQSESRFYADGLAMRSPVEGTVARGRLWPDSAFFYLGLDRDSSYVQDNPLAGVSNLTVRGKQRFEIFCIPCHGASGDARSIMVEKKMIVPPSFHEYRLRDSADGYLYHVVSNGFGNMPPYRYQIDPRDRWAIVAYLRELQASMPAVPNSTPESRLREQGGTSP